MRETKIPVLGISTNSVLRFLFKTTLFRKVKGRTVGSADSSALDNSVNFRWASLVELLPLGLSRSYFRPNG